MAAGSHVEDRLGVGGGRVGVSGGVGRWRWGGWGGGGGGGAWEGEGGKGEEGIIPPWRGSDTRSMYVELVVGRGGMWKPRDMSGRGLQEDPRGSLGDGAHCIFLQETTRGLAGRSCVFLVAPCLLVSVIVGALRLLPPFSTKRGSSSVRTRTAARVSNSTNTSYEWPYEY